MANILIVIKWDQKAGGMQEYTYPRFTMRGQDCMNIYQMHRVSAGNKAAAIPNFGNLKVRADSGEYFNIVSFFSGFGGTSPDGFTGNYGKETVGISEKVIGLLIPNDAKAQEYEEVLAKISARILIDIPNMDKRVQGIGALIEKSGLIKKPAELMTYLDSNMDRQLGLSKEDQITAFRNEAKALHYMLVDKLALIKELSINPAGMAYSRDAGRIADAQAQKNQLQAMINQITQQKAISEAVGQAKDEEIAQLKEDYIKIFGTLTDQILQLESEIKGISESTQSLLQDLNVALAEKIAANQRLEEELKYYRLNRQ
jgi:hypothetical protein